MKIMRLVAIFTAFGLLSIGCENEKDKPDDPVTGQITNGKTTAVFNPDITYGTMTDQDGNTYKTVVIGTQTWMAENLRTTKYRDGSRIKMGNSDWTDWAQGHYCEYNNTSAADSIATFGRLYNWNAINDSLNIAPAGWRIPTKEDWELLIAYIGGGAMAGGKLKETGFTLWASPNLDATNETGFTAIPGGYRADNGQYTGIGTSASFWSALEIGANSGQYVNLSHATGGIGSYMGFKSFGLSVRLCAIHSATN